MTAPIRVLKFSLVRSLWCRLSRRHPYRSGGHADNGMVSTKRALRLDPLSARTPFLNILGISFFHDGQYRKALDAFQHNIARGAPFGPHQQAYLTAAYAHLGEQGKVRKNYQILQGYGDDFAWKEWIQRWLKDPKGVRRVLDPLRGVERCNK